MRLMNNGRQRSIIVFAPDVRPGMDQFVYCKGCGERLEGQVRRVEPRAKVTVMMCENCRQTHGHQLMPATGAPSYCFRCGRPDEIFLERGASPVTHHVCPHCVPDRATRYRTGNFAKYVPPVEEAASV